MIEVDSPEFSIPAAHGEVPVPIPEAGQRRRRGALLAALVASLAVHLSLALWPSRATGIMEQAALPAFLAMFHVNGCT